MVAYADMVLWYGQRKGTLKFEACGWKDSDEVYCVVGINASSGQGFTGATPYSQDLTAHIYIVLSGL